MLIRIAFCHGVDGDWYFGSALGIMGKAKRKTRLADYDLKMAESDFCKARGKEKESFRVFFQRGESSPVRPKLQPKHSFSASLI